MKREFFKGAGSSLLIVIVAAILFVSLAFFINKGRQETSGSLKLDEYYSETEKEIADKVFMYLPEYLSEDTSAKIVNTAVKSYDVIMDADSVDVINEEHTAAMQRRIKTEILSYIDTDMSDDVLDDLSLGITEIILSAILEDLELPADKKDDYEQEYYKLVNSLQAQIDAIREKKMKVTIHANANNTVNPDSLLDAINSMSSEDLKLLEESLGIENSTEIIDGKDGINGKDGVDGRNGVDGRDGVNGKDGKDGINGRDGVNGKDGTNGADGKTTYIAYADDVNGTNFSLTPTETSKYVGTCITAQSSQPTDAKQYSNWQEYRSYVITATTDDDGVTTVHIN